MGRMLSGRLRGGRGMAECSFNSFARRQRYWRDSIKDMIIANGGYWLPRGYLDLRFETPLRCAFRDLVDRKEIGVVESYRGQDCWGLVDG
jgi:hypothetical protein